jgi:hypothetical protein
MFHLATLCIIVPSKNMFMKLVFIGLEIYHLATLPLTSTIWQPCFWLLPFGNPVFDFYHLATLPLTWFQIRRPVLSPTSIFSPNYFLYYTQEWISSISVSAVQFLWEIFLSWNQKFHKKWTQKFGPYCGSQKALKSKIYTLLFDTVLCFFRNSTVEAD